MGFDFHAETHENSDPYYKLIDDKLFPEHISEAGIFLKTHALYRDCSMSPARDHHVQKIESTQTGVVRTNCIDCLDRTNVA